jgi:transglutaminase-like putative cysteine protease
MSAKPAEILEAAAAAPAPADADVEMVFEEHNYQLDAQGRQRRAVHRVFRYLTEKGVEDWSSTEADWSAWCEERPAIRARVITPDGQVHDLDPETIGEVAADTDNPNLMSDQKLLRAPLPAIQVGAVVEEEVINREIRPLFDHGMVERLLLAELYPTRKFRLNVAYPAALPLQYEVLGSDLKPVRSERDGRVLLGFEAGPCPARPAPEPFQPPENNHWPEIVFSTGKSWAEVASRYAALVEARLDPDSVRPLVLETVGQEKDRRKIADRLLGVLREHVRYTGIEFGKAAIVPRAPKDTLARRYGDCKDQSALLVAMLRVAGVPAQVALLRTGRFSDIVPGLPGLGDFDHCIVYVPGDDPFWIDPSSRCTPAGRLPLGDQDRWAMVASPQTRALRRTPRMDYRQNTSSETVDVFLAESGKARVCVTVGTGSSCDEDMREEYASESTNELRKTWRGFFKEQYRTRSLARLEFSPPLDLSKPLQVVAEVADARVGQFQDNAATVAIHPDLLFDRLPGLFRGEESDKEEDDHGARTSQLPGSPRQTPLLLPEPHVRQIQFRIVPPPGFVAGELPEHTVRSYGPAVISRQFEVASDGAIVATFRLDTGPGTFTAAEVNALRQAIEDLGGPSGGPWEMKLALEHVVARHLAAGQMKEALAECRRLVQQHPDQAAQHQRFAEVLLKAGLGEAAREEARRAVDLDPKSAAAHAALARILAHDPVGRQFQPGMDWQAAAAEYRKSLDLDPADTGVRMDWAILLEHNQDGRHYAPDARLEEAVAEYRAARKQLGSRGGSDALELNLALALLHLEKYAELEKLADRPATSAAWKSLLVAAIAAQRGPAEAEHKAAQLSYGAAERRSLLEAAGEHLDDARLYAPAAALLQAGAPGAPDAAQLKARAKSLADRQKASCEAFQRLACGAVARGATGQAALHDALVAVEQSSYEDPVCLETLATVYAEMGKTSDALDSLHRSLALRGGPAQEADWYVLGRIAEQYGLDDVAAGLYRKLPSPAKPAADDVYTLAQHRLKALGKR